MTTELTPDRIEYWKRRIDTMTQVECAELQRFAASGHPVFRSDLPLWDYFTKHFLAVGGMTPEISKAIGAWRR